MRYMDRTVIGLSTAFLILLAAAFFMPEWVRFIGLQSLARGAVALGLCAGRQAQLISDAPSARAASPASAAAFVFFAGQSAALVAVGAAAAADRWTLTD